MTIGVYNPEKLAGPATVNRVKPTDVVTYSSALGDGTFFVVIRDGNGNNPRTLVLDGAQLATLPQIRRRAA